MRGSRLDRVVMLTAFGLLVSACSGGGAGTSSTTGSSVATAVTTTTSVSTTVPAAPASTAATAEAEAAGTFEVRVPFDFPPDVEFDDAQMAEAMSPIFAPYPVELLALTYDEGFLVFSLGGPVSVGLCEDLFNALGAGNLVTECAGFGEGSVAGEAPSSAEDFPPPDVVAAQAAVEGMLESVVVVTSNGGDPIGSGFFISEDGYILTNRHVAFGNEAMRVRLFDGTELPAVVVGVVAAPPGQADIAVLDVSGSGFPVAAIGDPSSLSRGDVMVQLGHPLGYGFWLATGGHFLGRTAGDLVSTAPGDTGFSGAPMFTDDGAVVALLWGKTSGAEGVVDFEANPPTPSASVDVVWSYEEFQSRSATRVNTAGVPIDTALSLASLIIERGGDVSPSDLVMASVVIEGTAMEVPAPIDPDTFGIPEFIASVQDFVLTRYPGSRLLDMTLDGEVATFMFDVLPPAEARREIIDLLVGTFGVVEFVDLSRVAPTGTFDSPPEDPAVTAAAEANLDSVVSLVFPFGGSATGFFISSDGYILTNAHVVSSDPEAPIIAVLADGSQLPTSLVGYDISGTPDVAVLDVDGSGFDAVEMGEYDALVAGDTVFVIGNPAGFGWWVVSAGEFIGELGPNDKADSFATTASGAAGSSGSPFFNAAGEVVGLLWGNRNEPPAAMERTITDIIWDPTEFWALKVHGSAGHPIDVAMATATQIIDSGGNVP